MISFTYKEEYRNQMFLERHNLLNEHKRTVQPKICRMQEHIRMLEDKIALYRKMEEKQMEQEQRLERDLQKFQEANG